MFVQVGRGRAAGLVRPGLARRAGAGGDHLASIDDADGGRSALEAIGALWVNGVELDTRPITAEAAVASVPPIALPREKYWPVKDSAQIVVRWAAWWRPAWPRLPRGRRGPGSGPGSGPVCDEVWEKVAGVVAKVSSYPRARCGRSRGWSTISGSTA